MINGIYKVNDELVRVLALEEDKAFVIDCNKYTMPEWIEISERFVLVDKLNVGFDELKTRSKEDIAEMHHKFNMIAGIIPVITDTKKKGEEINRLAEAYDVTAKTIRTMLCRYLVTQDIRCFLPQNKKKERCLSVDEKNMRWALNKFYYTRNQETLTYAYTMMLKERYCNEDGTLKDSYPSINQFRYYYKKHKNMRTEGISRDGIKDYQKNKRPLLGDGVQEFATAPGVAGMVDSTVCDIYLVNDEGKVIGRPQLTVCVDGYSSICMGYSIGWAGGVYGIKDLLMNIISDKTELGKKNGITIEKKSWDIHQLPGCFVSDKGTEYESENFQQITDLGCSIVSLPSYRPELKSVVEKFFDVFQDYLKPYLKGKGIIQTDFQTRGAHDYRKDAALTLKQFEKILLHCIVYYNSQRVIDYPYTQDMLDKEIRPYSCNIWEYGLSLSGANIILTDSDTLRKTMLPRCVVKFTRTGLIVNGLRYKNDSYIDEYLEGKEVVAAYNPYNSEDVYVIENGSFILFNLIQSRYKDKTLEEVKAMKEKKKELLKREEKTQIQAKIDLAEHILAIRNQTGSDVKSIKNIKENRKREIKKIQEERRCSND